MTRLLPQLCLSAFVALSAASTGALACGTEPAAPKAAAGSVRAQCDGRGEHSVTVEGDGFAAHEGKRVWLSAHEKDRGVVALVEGRVQNGRIQLACAKSLHSTLQYPSVAVVIDTDNDGRCSLADLQSRSIFYGWKSDVSHRVEPRSFGPVKSATPDYPGFDYCKTHFPR